jgi:hypothetical protein
VRITPPCESAAKHSQKWEENQKNCCPTCDIQGVGQQGVPMVRHKVGKATATGYDRPLEDGQGAQVQTPDGERNRGGLGRRVEQPVARPAADARQNRSIVNAHDARISAAPVPPGTNYRCFCSTANQVANFSRSNYRIACRLIYSVTLSGQRQYRQIANRRKCRPIEDLTVAIDASPADGESSSR